MTFRLAILNLASRGDMGSFPLHTKMEGRDDDTGFVKPCRLADKFNFSDHLRVGRLAQFCLKTWAKLFYPLSQRKICSCLRPLWSRECCAKSAAIWKWSAAAALDLRGLPYMTSAVDVRSGGPQKADERNEISWFVTVKRGEGVKKIWNFCGRHIWKPPHASSLYPEGSVCAVYNAPDGVNCARRDVFHTLFLYYYADYIRITK